MLAWNEELRWYLQGQAGLPPWLCSWCADPIAADAPLVGLWYHGRELRLHASCFLWVLLHDDFVWAVPLPQPFALGDPDGGAEPR